jgi:hypothetical protein
VIDMADVAQRASWLFDREQSMRVADALAAALAFSLPLSTSATGILAGLWLISLIPVIDLGTLRRVLAIPAGYLPVSLWLFALVGMLWADGISLEERLHGFGSFHKLLAIPLLMAHFCLSRRGHWLLYGFLAGCGIVLVLSGLFILAPELNWRGGNVTGVPVKDRIAQGAEFTICIFLIAYMAMERWRAHRLGVSIALWIAASLFLADILFIGSRTSLVSAPVLLVLFAFRYWSRRGAAVLVPATLAIVALSWWFFPELQRTLPRLWTEVRTFVPQGESTRAGERLVFWTKSVDFVANAPVIGHGTGSIPEQFRRTVEGKTGMEGLASTNPHQQTLAVAIQLGLIGAAVLWAMWIAHLLIFRGSGLASWTGLVVVVQNIVGSLFNSHLSDFTHGWIYVVGVGVAAGVTLKSAWLHMADRPHQMNRDD